MSGSLSCSKGPPFGPKLGHMNIILSQILQQLRCSLTTLVYKFLVAFRNLAKSDC
jgi:hypothetical protein